MFLSGFIGFIYTVFFLPFDRVKMEY